jgi:hypothetical protein
MRRLTIAYFICVIWLFGWLAGSFGLLPSLFASVITVFPAVVAWRMITSSPTIKRREYGYLGAVTLLALTTTSLLIGKWYDYELDGRPIFERKCSELQRRLAAWPEFRNVQVSNAFRYGGRLYLDGYVATKDAHDKLIGTYEWTFRNIGSELIDNVAYSGKPLGNATSP